MLIVLPYLSNNMKLKLFIFYYDTVLFYSYGVYVSIYNKIIIWSA